MARYAISDIHGCYHTLKELLSTIGLNETDELFLLGDFINRGEHSKEVVDFLMQLQKEGYQLHLLKGNHESMVFDSFIYKDWPGGEEKSLKSFGINHLKELPETYINWFSKLKYHHTSGQFVLVHAGLDFTKGNILEENENMLWIRDWYNKIDKDKLGENKIIHGHVSLPKQTIMNMRDKLDQNQFLGIDNGCWKAGEPGLGNLCCFDLDSRELWFQEFKD
jgi:serine/threonine protein phosphatase 1